MAKFKTYKNEDYIQKRKNQKRNANSRRQREHERDAKMAFLQKDDFSDVRD